MDAILADRAVSMSEFKRNPPKVVKGARSKPLVVLSHNKPAFYVLQPAVFEAILEQLDDAKLAPLIRERLASKQQAVEVSLDAL